MLYRKMVLSLKNFFILNEHELCFYHSTIVNILKFMTWTNEIVYWSEQDNWLMCLYFKFMKIT